MPRLGAATLPLPLEGRARSGATRGAQDREGSRLALTPHRRLADFGILFSGIFWSVLWDIFSLGAPEFCMARVTEIGLTRYRKGGFMVTRYRNRGCCGMKPPICKDCHPRVYHAYGERCPTTGTVVGGGGGASRQFVQDAPKRAAAGVSPVRVVAPAPVLAPDPEIAPIAPPSEEVVLKARKGRPVKADALTKAEKQRAYRERKRAEGSGEAS